MIPKMLDTALGLSEESIKYIYINLDTRDSDFKNSLLSVCDLEIENICCNCLCPFV